MAPMPARNTPSSALKAAYAGPNSTKVFTRSLSSASFSTTKEKTQYLAALRGSIVELQDEVNGFLTMKMEEDKALVSSAGSKVDDKAEEENYGEEVVDEEA